MAPETPDLMLRLTADDAERMTMPVELGGKTYPFVIDTGSHRSIVATELARKLELPALAPVQIVSLAGKATVDAVHLDQLKFGNQIISDLAALSIAHDNLGSAGLIGLDGLKNRRLTIDFRKRQMTVGRSRPRITKSFDRNVIIVEARSRLGQLILANSSIDGKRVSVILDTGAEYSIGNMALFHNLKRKRLIVPPQPITIRAVTGQLVAAQYTIVRNLEINSLTLKNVPMVFLDAPPFDELGLAEKPAMLLGMRMLQLFETVAIDFGNRRVDFRLPDSGGARETSTTFLAAG
jgi:predicted aspartyl protease